MALLLRASPPKRLVNYPEMIWIFNKVMDGSVRSRLWWQFRWTCGERGVNQLLDTHPQTDTRWGGTQLIVGHISTTRASSSSTTLKTLLLFFHFLLGFSFRPLMSLHDVSKNNRPLTRSCPSSTSNKASCSFSQTCWEGGGRDIRWLLFNEPAADWTCWEHGPAPPTVLTLTILKQLHSA